MWSGQRLTRGFAAAVVVTTAAAACSSQTPDEPASQLLDASTVAGTSVESTAVSKTSAFSCDVEAESVWAGSTSEDLRAFSRERQGASQTLVVGAWKQTKKGALHAIDTLANRMSDDKCDKGLLVQPVAGFDLRSTAFESTVFDGKGAGNEDDSSTTATFYKRVYRYIDGYMVTIWMKSHGTIAPSTEDLRVLLHKQIDKLPT